MSSENLPSDSRDLLETCENEPIHTPGAIQPHGYLLTLDADTRRILQTSINLPEKLGTTGSELCRLKLDDLLDEVDREAYCAYLLDKNYKSLLPLPLTLKYGDKNLAVCGIPHKQDDLLILELEPLDEPLNYNLSSVLHQALNNLHDADTFEESLAVAVREIENLTGYDRVMVYRFDQDWHGEVVAEKRKDHLPPYLGLHYPASDIPAQARRLYQRNLLRMLVDVDYNSVALEPQLLSRGGELDMSDCVLRSISPVHVEYLKNMGVQATLTISILLKGELWGLIACHHYDRKFLPHWTRSACQLFGQNLSLKILGLEESQKYSMKLAFMDTFEHFLTAARREPEHILDSFEETGHEFAAFFDSGCALFLKSNDEQMIEWSSNRAGKNVITREFFRAVAQMVRQSGKRFYQCDNLAIALDTSDPPFAGVLAINISAGNEDWIMFFREARTRLVKWAGNPDKTLNVDERDPGRLHPRGSFALWTEEVKDRSLPWTDAEVNMAQLLQARLLEIKHENLEAEKARIIAVEQERSEFVSALAHDLKNPIAGALRIMELLKTGSLGDSITKNRETLEKLISSHKNLLARINSILLLYQSPDGTPRLDFDRHNVTRLLRSAIDNATAIGDCEISMDSKSLELHSHCDPDAMTRVFENLIANAIKYSDDHISIDITLCLEGEDVTIIFRDNGFGIDASELPFIFERFYRGRSSKISNHGGSGLGLHICKKIIEAHGGSISCKSAVSKGSEFVVKLPQVV